MMASKKDYPMRKPLDCSSSRYDGHYSIVITVVLICNWADMSIIMINVFCSFHASMNGSLHSNSFLNQSSKTPHQTPSRKPSKTPNKKSSGGSKNSKNSSRCVKTPSGGDRFMAEKPNVDMAHYLLHQQSNDSGKTSDANTSSANSSVSGDSLRKNENSVYSRSLTENVLGVPDLGGLRILSFQKKPKIAPEVV